MNSPVIDRLATIRAVRFSGERKSLTSVRVEADGACRVYDPTSGAWTLCHALTAADMARAVRQVQP